MGELIKARKALAAAIATAILGAASLAIAASASASSADASWGEVPASVGGQIGTGAGPRQTAFSPDGSLLATVNNTANSVSVFSVSGVGQAATVAPLGAPLPIGPSANGIAFNPAGSLLAVSMANTVNGVGTVSVFAVVGSGAGATLDAVAAPPTTSGGAAPEAIAFDPAGSVLAVAVNGTTNGAVLLYSVSGSGTGTTFTPIGAPVPLAGRLPDSIAFSPDGSLLAVADGTADTVTVFAVSGSGGGTSLTQLGAPLPTGSTPYQLAFAPNGTVLAMVNAGSNTIGAYAVSGTGASAVFTALVPTPTAALPLALAFSPDGSLLATADAGASTVSLFGVSGAGAQTTFTSRQTLPAGSLPWGAAFRPDGLLLATSNSGSNTVSLFAPVVRTVTFDPNGGTGTMAEQSASTPTALTANAFVRTGYTFTGWNTAADGSGTAYANGAVFPFTSDATLYAQWAEAVAPGPSPTPGAPGAPGAPGGAGGPSGPGAGSESQLAATGTSTSWPWTAGALGMCLVGTALIVVRRRAPRAARS